MADAYWSRSHAEYLFGRQSALDAGAVSLQYRLLFARAAGLLGELARVSLIVSRVERSAEAVGVAVISAETDAIRSRQVRGSADIAGVLPDC